MTEEISTSCISFKTLLETDSVNVVLYIFPFIDKVKPPPDLEAMHLK